jgi:hypothetical protein
VNDACVLNPSVREEQSRAHSAYAFYACVACHLTQPPGRDHFRIIIEKENILSLNLFDRSIVDSGEAES